MLQECSDNLLLKFIEQEIAHNVNLDKVQNTFKKLKTVVERHTEL